MFSYEVSKAQNYDFFFIRASFMKKTIKNKKQKKGKRVILPV